jgi:pyruvate dehydrogenase complex dehydrogenase (E1) component
MKTVRKIIKEMVDKYPNDMELGARVRWYIRWLYDSIKEHKHEYKDDKKWNL